MNERPTVLCVEDDPKFRGILRRHYQQKYAFIEAQNLEDALEVVRSGAKIDVAIIDMHLPHRGGRWCDRRAGVEVAETLLKMAPDVKPVVLTAYATEDSQEEWQPHGIFLIVKKGDPDWLQQLDKLLEHLTRVAARQRQP